MVKNGLVDGREQRKTQIYDDMKNKKEAEIQALKAQNRLLEMESDVLKSFQALEERWFKEKTNHGIQNDRSVKTSIPYPSLCRIFRHF